MADAEGGVACIIPVWLADGWMPTLMGDRRRRPEGRADCKADIVEVVRAAGRAQTRKEVVRVLKSAGKPHGVGTIAKALADLTASGTLVNRKDKRGYRLPEWVRPSTPSLFG